jgi:hypothetical protein
MMIVQETDQIVENPCEEYREIIREVFVRILSKPNFPVSARLFSMACFAYETDLFMYPDSPDFTEDMLAHEVNRVAGHVYERLWLEEFRKKPMKLELPMSMIQSLLLGMVQKCEPGFKKNILAAWAQYIPENHEKCSHKVVDIFDVKFSDSATQVKCSYMAGMYKKRRRLLYKVLGTEIEKQIEDFCIRFVLSADHTEYRYLFAYVQRLVLDVVLLKYFIVSDPGLAEAIGKTGANRDSILSGSEKDREEPCKKLAAIVKRFSGNAAREEKSIIKLSRSLVDQGMLDIAHTALLIHF